MFNLTIAKNKLLSHLLVVIGAVDKKPSFPILANILLKLSPGKISLTATDLEIEITASLDHDHEYNEEITIPAKKFVDIIRSLDDNSSPRLNFKEKNIHINSGGGKFKLATLPAQDFPKISQTVNEIEFSLERLKLIALLQMTYFALSQNDVRIFLNSLLMEIDAQSIITVATDGHRMAIYKLNCDVGKPYKFLLSRKCVQEILRLLNNIDDEKINLAIGEGSFKLITNEFHLQAKLIDSRYPPYNKLITQQHNKTIFVDRDILKRSLGRIMILTNEKSKAILLHMKENSLTLIVNNQEHEEAIETIDVRTEGEEIKIGINATYLAEVLNFIADGLIKLNMSTMDSSILIQSIQNDNYKYIIMPMKL